MFISISMTIALLIIMGCLAAALCDERDCVLLAIAGAIFILAATATMVIDIGMMGY